MTYFFIIYNSKYSSALRETSFTEAIVKQNICVFMYDVYVLIYNKFNVNDFINNANIIL